MTSHKLKVPVKIAFALLPLGYLTVVRVFLHSPVFLPDLLPILIFTAAVVYLTGWLKFENAPGPALRFNLAWITLLVTTVLGGWLSTVLESQPLAWAALGALLALSLKVHEILGIRHFFIRWWLSAGLVGGAAALAVVLFNQVWIRFSEEEFFIAVQAILLFGFWLSFCGSLCRTPPDASPSRQPLAAR